MLCLLLGELCRAWRVEGREAQGRAGRAQREPTTGERRAAIGLVCAPRPAAIKTRQCHPRTV